MCIIGHEGIASGRITEQTDGCKLNLIICIDTNWCLIRLWNMEVATMLLKATTYAGFVPNRV